MSLMHFKKFETSINIQKYQYMENMFLVDIGQLKKKSTSEKYYINASCLYFEENEVLNMVNTYMIFCSFCQCQIAIVLCMLKVLELEIIQKVEHPYFTGLQANYESLCNSCSLNSLPAALGALTSLQQLDVGNNKLTSLPDEIGLLCQLQILKASNNRYYLSSGDY